MLTLSVDPIEQKRQYTYQTVTVGGFEPGWALATTWGHRERQVRCWASVDPITGTVQVSFEMRKPKQRGASP